MMACFHSSTLACSGMWISNFSLSPGYTYCKLLQTPFAKKGIFLSVNLIVFNVWLAGVEPLGSKNIGA
jgi:hypothetical protein